MFSDPKHIRILIIVDRHLKDSKNDVGINQEVKKLANCINPAVRNHFGLIKKLRV